MIDTNKDEVKGVIADIVAKEIIQGRQLDIKVNLSGISYNILFLSIFNSLQFSNKGILKTRLKRLSVSMAVSIYLDLHQFTLIWINLLWSSHFLFMLIEGQI